MIASKSNSTAFFFVIGPLGDHPSVLRTLFSCRCGMTFAPGTERPCSECVFVTGMDTDPFVAVKRMN